ncbi:MAG: phosphoribosylamine--glycine ligase [Kiritimatiellae bacterium]|nr:phosphoribosylamine--glycine ligase [Kiritimatiellia bacterium]
MKILVIGSGGREHAIVWRLSRDSSSPTLFCAPGNAGTAALAENVPLKADDLSGLLAWAKENRPDLTVVGPEVPLCMGIADLFAAEGLRVFGPCRDAARMEGSKRFSKEVMTAAGVPTALAEIHTKTDEAIAALDRFTLPVVIKADGLAAGKGVIIAQTRQEAEDAIRSMLDEGVLGNAGAQVLIETFLDGEEASILALVDGEHTVLLPPSQDHKRVFDGDQGPNTGGMGAYSPAPVVTEAMLPEIRERIILPVVRELKKRGITYKGVLYAGLMIGPGGSIHVLEFNVRFGDPETQVVLPRIGGDLIPVLEACIDGTLSDDLVTIRPEAAATVVIAAKGYPGAYAKGTPITGLEEAAKVENAIVFHAGTARKEGATVTAGGRVLAVSALGADLRSAVDRAYATVRLIGIEGAHYRKDIAHRAFKA